MKYPLAVARAYLGEEDFPDPSGAHAHGMPPFVPIVKVADNADYFRVGRPYGEADTLHAQARNHVRTHGAVALILRSLARNVQIEIGDQTRKSIRVFDVNHGAAPQRKAEFVASRILCQGSDEQSFRSRFAHRNQRAIGRHHGGIHGLWKKRAHLPAASTFMRPQHGERIAMRAVEDGLDFLRSHAQLLWQRAVTMQELGTVGPQ